MFSEAELQAMAGVQTDTYAEELRSNSSHHSGP